MDIHIDEWTAFSIGFGLQAAIYAFVFVRRAAARAFDMGLDA